VKGVRQANRLEALGFAQVYLWVFVAIDTREQNSGRYTYEGANADLRSTIENAIFTAQLHPRVGLVRFEWVQPMDRAPFELGAYGGSLKRLAEPITQRSEITAWVKSL
jgi:hypothetical protein